MKPSVIVLFILNFLNSRGEFTEPGLEGKESSIEVLKSHPGGNPSVHFNTYLKWWLRVWHTWQGDNVY